MAYLNGFKKIVIGVGCVAVAAVTLRSEIKAVKEYLTQLARNHPQEVKTIATRIFEAWIGARVQNVSEGSIIFELICSSDTIFQKLVEATESKEVERRLQQAIEDCVHKLKDKPPVMIQDLTFTIEKIECRPVDSIEDLAEHAEAMQIQPKASAEVKEQLEKMNIGIDNRFNLKKEDECLLAFKELQTDEARKLYRRKGNLDYYEALGKVFCHLKGMGYPLKNLSGYSEQRIKDYISFYEMVSKFSELRNYAMPLPFFKANVKIIKEIFMEQKEVET